MYSSVKYLAILFVLCGFNTHNVSEEGLVPLNEEAVWTYVLCNDTEGLRDTLVYKIEKDTTIGDGKYCIFKQVYHNQTILQLFLRSENGRTYFRRTLIEAEQLYLPSIHDAIGFSFPVVEKMDSLTIELISLSDTLRTPGGNYDSLVVTRSTNRISGAELTYYFQMGVGLIGVKSSDKLYAYLLKYRRLLKRK